MSETLKEKNYALVEKVVTSPGGAEVCRTARPQYDTGAALCSSRYVSESGTRTAVGPQDLDDKDRP